MDLQFQLVGNKETILSTQLDSNRQNLSSLVVENVVSKDVQVNCKTENKIKITKQPHLNSIV